MPKKIFILFVIVLIFASNVFAWDSVGHKTIAYIAWQKMTPAARERVMKILMNAPEDSGLSALYPQDARSEAARQQEFFMTAAYWSDIIRDKKFENRFKYHHGTWHYLDTFWRTTTDGKVEILTDLESDKENAVERLYYFDKVLRDVSAKDSEKAIAIAWILHLGGDIHQPLHASARVTEQEPKGDKGGNDFSLSPANAAQKTNLHSFWDRIVGISIARTNDAPDAVFLPPIGNDFMKKFPLAKMQNRLESGKFDEWQRESFKIASTELYPASLKRGEMPSKQYQKMAFRISEEQIALAGYRLGAWLNEIFGANPTTAQNPPCKIIRKVNYPVSQTNDGKQKLEICVLNLCPSNKGMAARPMYSMMINGKIEMFEYDVEKVFKTEKEAREYAAQNGISDISIN